VLSEEATIALNHLARESHFTLSTLGSRRHGPYCYRDTAVRRTYSSVATVAGRQAALSGVESMVGMFINSLPVRIGVPAMPQILSWLHRIQEFHRRDERARP